MAAGTYGTSRPFSRVQHTGKPQGTNLLVPIVLSCFRKLAVQLLPRVNTELAIYMLHMVADRSLGQHEPFANFGHSLILGKHDENILLSPRQPIQTRQVTAEILH